MESKLEESSIISRGDLTGLESDEYMNKMLLAQKLRDQGVLDWLLVREIIIYAGKDEENRPLLVFIGQRVPETSDAEQLDQILMYLILKMDEFVREPYCLVYCQRGAGFLHYGTFSWFLNCYSWLPRAYKKNLKVCCILHPSFLVRVFLNMIYPFVSQKVWDKITYYNSLMELCSRFSSVDLRPILPLFLTRSESELVPLLGKPLEIAVSRSRNRKLPTIVSACIHFLIVKDALGVEGLFRVAGNSEKMNLLQKEFDRDEELVFESDVHTVACAMKRYILNLPDPAIPFRFTKDVLKVAPLLEEGKTLEAVGELKAILFRLPQAHFDLLEVLIPFLAQVAARSSENLVSA